MEFIFIQKEIKKHAKKGLGLFFKKIIKKLIRYLRNMGTPHF